MNAVKPHANDHIVSDGLVHCLRTGNDVSVETCWMCERLVSFETEDGSEIVRCAGPTLSELLPELA